MSESKKYQLNNRYLAEKKPKKHRFLKFCLVLAAFFILGAGAIYLLFFSPALKIKSIEISGAKNIEPVKIKKIVEQILQEKILSKISRNNFILLPQNKIVDAVLSSSPEIKTVKLGKKLTDRLLKVEIVEREPSLIWCHILSPTPAINSTSTSSIATSKIISNNSDSVFNPTITAPEADKCFFMDSEGFVFKEAPILSGGRWPTVYDQTGREIGLAQSVVSVKILNFILEVKKEIAAAGLNLGDFVIKSYSLGDLEIIASDGWLVYLDLNYPVQTQISALKRTLDEDLKNNQNLLEYIDLRVPNRVYYKLKGAE